MTGLDPEAPKPPDTRGMSRECRGVPSLHEIGGAPAVRSQNQPTNPGDRHAISRPGPESPSTAKRAIVFGQLEVLSGKSRLKTRHPRERKIMRSDNTAPDFSRAVEHHRSGRLREAERIYRAILDVRPDDSDVLHLLGVIAHQEGRHEAAVDLISRALTNNRDDAAYFSNLGNALHALGRIDEAVQAYRSALSLNPNYAMAYFNLGNALRDRGQIADAVRAYRSAVEIEPGYGEAHNNLGNAVRRQGEKDAALVAFRAAVAADPRSGQFRDNLAGMLIESGFIEQSVEAYEALIRIEPGNPDGYNHLGIALNQQGRLEDSVSAFRNAISIRHDFANAHNNLGNTLKAQGKYGDATESYRKALAIDPRNANARFNLAMALYRDDHLEPAARELRLAVEADPGHSLARFHLGMIIDRQGDEELARTHFAQLIERAPENEYFLDSWRYAKSRGAPTTRFFTRAFETLQYAMDLARSDGMVLEFGVRYGTSINFIATLTDQPVHGFDSFEGLPETWGKRPVGTYTTRGYLPDVAANVELHAGWFANTLPRFVAEHPGPVKFINVDCDIYSSTSTIFDHLDDRIGAGSVIVFDEYICNPDWREDEYRAFQEAVQRYSWRYEYLAFNFHSRQTAVRII